MAEKKVYMGSVGPAIYDDDNLIADEDGDFDGVYEHALITDHQLIVTEAPSLDDHVARYSDIQGKILDPVAVTDIDDPSTELNALTGAAGVLLLAYEVGANADESTLYAWDNAVGTGEDVPHIVAGSSGFWIAVAGKYVYTQHNELGGLNVGDYQHLLAAEYTELSEWLDDVTLGSNGLTSVPEMVLVPCAAALSDVQGGMYYSNVDDSVYVCTSAT